MINLNIYDLIIKMQSELSTLGYIVLKDSVRIPTELMDNNNFVCFVNEDEFKFKCHSVFEEFCNIIIDYVKKNFSERIYNYYITKSLGEHFHTSMEPCYEYATMCDSMFPFFIIIPLAQIKLQIIPNSIRYIHLDPVILKNTSVNFLNISANVGDMILIRQDLIFRDLSNHKKIIIYSCNLEEWNITDYTHYILYDIINDTN